jgi:ribosome maturation protein Sdo1
LFTASQGTNTEANRNAIPTERFAIAISDLQIKVAELQRARAQLADTIREKVAVALVKFDEGRTDFQIAQVVGARAIDQFKVFELRYIRGNNDTEGYLAKQSQLDRVKADTYASWGKMRRSLFEIKLLVLGVKDSEI